MICRVIWIMGVLATLSVPGWGITIPIGSMSASGVHTLSTGISATFSPIAARDVDDSWAFYAHTGSTLTPLNDYVVRSDRPPISNGVWSSNDSFSQWISPNLNAAGAGGACCALPTSSYTSLIAAMTFSVPAMTNPPNLPQWWLVMRGLVWGDDTVTGYALYSGSTPSGTPVYSRTFSTSAGPLTPQSFSVGTWVNPGSTYTLAFMLSNTANSVTGFRLQMNEAFVTPEPGAWALMLSAGAGLVFASWRRRRAKKPQS